MPIEFIFMIPITIIVLSGIFISKESQKKNWIPTSGKILDVTYKKVNPSGGMSVYGPGYIYRIFLKYQYRMLEGRFESDNEMAVSDDPETKKEVENLIATKYRIGNEIQIFYNPQNNSQSYIEKTEKNWPYTLLYIGIFLFIVVLGIYLK